MEDHGSPAWGTSTVATSTWPVRSAAASSGCSVRAVSMKRSLPSGPPSMQAKQRSPVSIDLHDLARAAVPAGDEHALGRRRVGDPDPTLGVEADAVGQPAVERRPHPLVRQRAVGRDVERASAAGRSSPPRSASRRPA